MPRQGIIVECHVSAKMFDDFLEYELTDYEIDKKQVRYENGGKLHTDLENMAVSLILRKSSSAQPPLSSGKNSLK